MKRLILFVFLIGLTLGSKAQNVETLSSITGEKHSLWNALASLENIHPNTWIKKEFREKAKQYAELIDMEYFCNELNAWNNVEILNHPVVLPMTGGKVVGGDDWHTVFDYSDMILDDKSKDKK